MDMQNNLGARNEIFTILISSFPTNLEEPEYRVRDMLTPVFRSN